MPKKTIETIVRQGHHYVVQVKGNQPKLLKALRSVAHAAQPLLLEEFKAQDKSRGRRLRWHVCVFAVPEAAQALGWKHLRRFIHVYRHHYRNGKHTQETAYYISDVEQASAADFYRGIRQHWHIENRLHWVKDVLFNEDHNRIRGAHAPLNCSILASIAINILRQAGCTSIKHGRIMFAANVKELVKFLRT